MRRLLAGVASFVGFVVLWKLVSVVGDYPDYILPAPEAVIGRGSDALRSGLLLEHTLATLGEILAELDAPAEAPVGVCFPAIVLEGRTMSAANVSEQWIGLEAERLFEAELGRSIHFVNDADAAGVAEARYGAAAGQPGLTILTTLGTGIGSAFLFDGTLIPNTELGHLELDGDQSLRAAHAIGAGVRRALIAAIPNADVIIHHDPADPPERPPARR